MKRRARRILSWCLLLALVIGVLPGMALAATTPADLGWSTDGDDFTGWTVSDGKITGDYAAASAKRIWKSVEDINNFKISFDITCNNTTSPYIQIAGVIIEVDANGGNGNQVYPKINGAGSNWLDAEGCEVHVQINRYNGGQLTITLTGKGNATPVVLTAACPGGNDCIEIGMYRGGYVSIAGYAVAEPDAVEEPGDDREEGPGAEASDRDSEVWNLGENWAVNEDDTLLILTQATGGVSEWKQTLDMTQDLNFSMDWVLNTTIDTNNTWAEKLSICLKDPATGDFLFLRLQRYRSGGGMYQVYISAQWWDAANSSWSAQALDVWTSKMSGGVLDDVKVHIIRDSTQEALQIKLVDNDDGTSLGSAVLKATNFAESTVAEKFANVILKGTQVPLVIGCDGNSAPYYLRNPVLGELEKEVQQNQFTADDVWKAEMDKDGNLSFITKNLGYGWLEYNAGLDVAAGLDFSYTVTVTDYGSSGASSAIRLRYSESPEDYFFARIQFREGQFAVLGQRWNGDWTYILGGNNWVDGTTEDDTWIIRVVAGNGTLTLEIQDNKGNVLGTYTSTDMPESFFSCENLELMYCAEGNGLHRLSNFKGLPEIYSADLRSEPFGKVVFAGDIVSDWTDALIKDISEYQNKTPDVAETELSADAILAAKGNLIVIADGLADAQKGVSAADHAAALETLIARLKKESVSGTVIVVTGLPYIKGMDSELCAAYNAAIRAVAQKNNVLYANIYRAQSQASWTVDADGGFTGTGDLLVAGEILQELLRSCTCLAVNTTMDLKVSATAPVEKTQAALDAFKSAADADAMRAAVEDGHLGADLDLYLGFSSTVQEKVIAALVALDRSKVDSFEAADAIISAVSMKTGLENKRSIVTGAPFTTYVAVGDSISYGETSVNKATDGWVPRLASLISQAQGQEVKLINKAISGTRMCTVTDNKMFPAAKDTVQEYIVANDPDLITISYGINDLHAGTSLEEFITTYRAYLTEVTEGCPDAVIIVCGLSAKGGDADSGTLKKWNAAIKALAEEFGLIYNDSYSDTRGVEWLLSDGLHPTNAGYRVMANAAFRTLCAYVDLTGETQPGDDQEPDDSEVGDNDPTVTPDAPETPETADPMQMGLLLLLLVAALVGTAAVVVYKRRTAR